MTPEMDPADTTREEEEAAEMTAMNRFYAVVNLFLEGFQSVGEPRGYHCCGGTGQQYLGSGQWASSACECTIDTDWDAATASMTAILEDADDDT